MRKLLWGLSLFVIIVVLGGCSASVNKETTVKSEDKAGQAVELKGQDVSDITKLATPDELVYLHDGVKTIYKKDSPRFQKIIQINAARQTNRLEALKLFIDYNNVAKQGDYLIYEYTKTNYAPIYFELAPSLDNWVANYYGSNLLPSYVKTDDPTKTKAHGHLAPADELLEYLNIRY